jgi:hypothetical protein
VDGVRDLPLHASIAHAFPGHRCAQGRRSTSWVGTLLGMEDTAAEGEGDAGLPEPSQSFDPQRRVRAFAYMLRVYAGETPECDANTAAFLAGIVRGMGSAMLRRVRGMTNEQADAAFLQWVNDQHALWGSLAVMENAAAEGEGDPL